MRNYMVLVELILLVLICSCTGKANKSSKPVTTLEILPSAKSYHMGQPLTLHVKTKNAGKELAKTEVYLNDLLVLSGNQAEMTQEITGQGILGVNTVRIVSENHDGKAYTLLRNFTLLSDTEPLSCNYRVVKEYSHNNEHFTQGLEFHKGYLYEGTGENGKSALYRIDFPSGRISRSVKLDEQYFGEGITILEDKIYQLTYKHRKGFIYNLSDFGVTDSFAFASQEGWGLTNDGNYLIMSDGTETLTWINPVDFSVVRRVQVADHLKVYRYLNELEYDHGFIWANVWGTDLILKIEASTGKVVAQLNLKGILSVMDAHSSDRIDVLNGIALMPGTGHLLVTGKLWPRMFEIETGCSE